jgi:gluconokinase
MVIVVMGVSGCGKTRVGKLLAKELGWQFFDGDDFHPRANVEKMGSGIPLTDADRKPWLEILNRQIHELIGSGRQAVVACSALRQSYRDILRDANEGVAFVFLRGDFELIRRRMERRKGHYMKAEMLRSQFKTLEEPHDALSIDVSESPATIVDRIRKHFGL